MKKITLFLIILGFFLKASAQYDFAPIVGPTNVAQGTSVTINLNDLANSAGVPVSSTGSYDSYSISVDWAAGGGGPFSSEAQLTMITTAGSLLIDEPTTGGQSTGADTTLTFEGNFLAVYNPITDGYIDLVPNQTWAGSDANWSNILVTLFESPTCVTPSEMETASLTTTSVELSWNAGDSETIWNVEYNSGTDFMPGNGEEEGSVNVTGTPVTSFAGLTESTQYFVYYQADCGTTDGASEWVGPFNFLTAYCESMPSSNDGDGIGQVQLGSETFISGGDIFYEDFTSPTVDLAAAITSNLQITFTTGPDYDTNVWIDLNNDLVFDNVNELVYVGESAAANPTVLDASFTMPDVPLGIYNMRIVTTDFLQTPPNPCYNGTWGVTMDFTVNITAAPDCIPPSALAATAITQDSAELTWNGGATGVSWDLEWGPTGFTPGTGTLVTGLTTQTYTLPGLSAGTAYDFYVLSNCAGGVISTVSGPSTFFTATPGETCANAFPMTVEVDCDAATPITFNFENGADIDANGENPSCDGFNNFGYWMSFTAPSIGSVVINFDGSADNIGLDIFDACGGTSVFDCIDNGLDAGDNSGVIGGLTPGNTYYAVIWRDAQSGTADLCIQEGPTCPFPINLEATNITESSVDLGWTENGTSTSWNIEWGPTGFTPGTGTTISGVTTNPYNLMGLIQNTDYDFYVQAICTGDISDFEGPFAFTTAPQTNFVLDCTVDGPLTQDYCYGDNDTNVFTFASTDGTLLNLTFNAGGIESCCDNLLVFDSNGDPLYSDNNGGNLGGLTFQSTGDTISFQIDSDGSVSCANGSACCTESINYTVSCATCINPEATYAVIDDCANGEQFLIDVNIDSLGDATSLTISNNINADATPVTAVGVYQIGPFPFLVDVVVTVTSDQDANCIINSQAIQLLACPPTNDNCDGAIIAMANEDSTCDIVTSGTILAATPSGVPDGDCTGTDDDVWFEFTALNEIQIISLINITGGIFDLSHGVYEGSCGSLNEVYCSDNESSVTPALIVGNTYYIRVFSGGNDPETSTFDLCIRPAPSNIICENAENFCSVGGALESPNIIGIPSTGQVACLFSVPNPTWNIIQVGESGAIEIQIEQTDDTGAGLDVDFVIWGPFTSIDQACTDIILEDCPTCPNNTTNPDFYPFGNIIDCSYSGDSIENLTIDNALAGEIYMLLVTNFSGDPGNISIEQTNSDGTDSGTIEAEITAEIASNDVFIPQDNDPTEIDEVSVCGFNSVTIETNSPFADEYVWFEDGFEIIGETSSTLTVPSGGFTPEYNTNYQVQATDNQCGATALSQIVIINFYDDAGSVAPQNITVCDGPGSDGMEAFDLNALSASLGLTGFTISYYTNTTDANTATGAVPSPYNSSGETLIIRIEDTDAATDGFLGCRQLSQVELVVNPRPIISQPMDFIVCDDLDGTVDGATEFDLTSINTDVTTETGIVISYHTSQANADSGDADITNTAYSSGGETIFVRAENTVTGCYETTSFNLEVNIVPLADFPENIDYEVCPNATVPIMIGITPDNFTDSDVTVNWSLDGDSFSGSGLTLDNVLVAGDYSATITFNDTGCVNTITQTVIELDSCVFPQGISPNNDMMNDTFDLSSFDVTKLEIFNRNGTLVYSKANYVDEWVGQTNDGDELPVGTYFYTVIYEGGLKSKSAWVYINK